MMRCETLVVLIGISVLAFGVSGYIFYSAISKVSRDYDPIILEMRLNISAGLARVN